MIQNQAHELQALVQSRDKRNFSTTKFIAITSGKGGVGKSSILKLIIGEPIKYNGEFKIINDLKISYVSQSTEKLKGNLKTFARENKIDESIFKAMLSKMGFSKIDFDTDIKDMSERTKKRKFLIAKKYLRTS